MQICAGRVEGVVVQIAGPHRDPARFGVVEEISVAGADYQLRRWRPVAPECPDRERIDRAVVRAQRVGIGRGPRISLSPHTVGGAECSGLPPVAIVHGSEQPQRVGYAVVQPVVGVVRGGGLRQKARARV